MTGMRVYISGPLTNDGNDGADRIEHLKKFYENIAKVCEQKGYIVYVPHLHTDPVIHASVSPRDVYNIDVREVAKADLVLAYVGQPSHGVGAEVERAFHTGTKVVLLYEQGTKISRLIRGCPAVVAEVKFTGEEDGLRQIGLFIGSFNE